MPLVASSDIGTSLPTGDVPPAAGVMLTFPAETPDNTDRFQDNYHMMEGENEDTYSSTVDRVYRNYRTMRLVLE
jgi:hypothetical protein